MTLASGTRFGAYESIAAIGAGAPASVFAMRASSFYAASPDGQRFLVTTPLADVATAPITVILNWAGRSR